MNTASTDLPTPDAQLRLGAFIEDGGTTFGLWAPRATRVELALVGEDRGQTNYDLEPGRRTASGRSTCPASAPSSATATACTASGHPDAGARFNPAKLLLDPYARAITGGVDYSGPILDHTAGLRLRARPRATPSRRAAERGGRPTPRRRAPIGRAGADGRDRPLRAARQGLHPAAPGRARAPARHATPAWPTRP